MPEIKSFIEQLRCYSAPQVFNPWHDYDTNYDIGIDAPKIRRQHLDKYLRLRIPNAKYVFIAEVLGYKGGHFSGIAMTSERMLVGKHRIVKPTSVIGEVGKRTSEPESLYARKRTERKFGFTESTATVVWKEILNSCLSPHEVILWNIFPFHPYEEEGLLTNRKPEPNELIGGLKYLRMLMKLCPKAKVFSIGQLSAGTLDEYDVTCDIKFRHLSKGGIGEFQNQFRQHFNNR